jgi:hypothetical protein
MKTLPSLPVRDLFHDQASNGFARLGAKNTLPLPSAWLIRRRGLLNPRRLFLSY